MATETNSPSKQTTKQALIALDNMAIIVKNEMIIRGQYASEGVVNKKLAAKGTICRGHAACAIGSVFIGGGIKPHDVITYAPESERDAFLMRRAGLRLAIGALNEAAIRYANKHDLILDDPEYYADAIEGLFENNYNDETVPIEKVFGEDTSGLLARKDLLKVIAKARKRIENGKAQLRDTNASAKGHKWIGGNTDD